MSYVSCACHAAVMNDSMSMADTLYRQHCEALSCLGGTRHFRRCWASYFHSAEKMSASAGWGAPSLILLLLSKQEVQEQRQSTSFAFSFAEKEVLWFKVSKWKTCWLSFFNLLGDKQTKEVLFFNVLTAIVPKTIFFKPRDSAERKSKDFAIWTGMIETVLRKVYIEI